MDGPNKEAQLQELERELKMRQRVYPRWIREGRLDADVSEHRIKCLIAVIDDFKERHAPGAKQGSLGI